MHVTVGMADYRWGANTKFICVIENIVKFGLNVDVSTFTRHVRQGVRVTRRILLSNNLKTMRYEMIKIVEIKWQ